MKGNKKDKNIKKHFKMMAYQRYGIIDNSFNEKISSKIKKGDSKCIKIQSRTRTIHEVKYDKITYRVVYDKLTKLCVTILLRKDEEWNKKQNVVYDVISNT